MHVSVFASGIQTGAKKLSNCARRTREREVLVSDKSACEFPGGTTLPFLVPSEFCPSSIQSLSLANARSARLRCTPEVLAESVESGLDSASAAKRAARAVRIESTQEPRLFSRVNEDGPGKEARENR